MLMSLDQMDTWYLHELNTVTFPPPDKLAIIFTVLGMFANMGGQYLFVTIKTTPKPMFQERPPTCYFYFVIILIQYLDCILFSLLVWFDIIFQVLQKFSPCCVDFCIANLHQIMNQWSCKGLPISKAAACCTQLMATKGILDKHLSQTG